ncbi:MAG: hypothetical protein KAU50_02685, partial [Candidatus Marinimicrobia bacterium]|nr:hypothetical protein [Candidatus Neomarinimicrobiota bacterium]
RRERDRAVNFFCTASRMSPPANSSSENLCDSIESMLSAFVGLYLGDYDMTSFRCSVGIVNDNEILYLCGVSPEVRPHTKNPLPLDKSLAGVAVKNPGMTYFSGDEGVQFIKKHGNRYCAVM